MLINISIKLTRVGPNAGPFNIYDQNGNIIAANVSRKSLIQGVTYAVEDTIESITITSLDECAASVTKSVETVEETTFFTTETEIVQTGCLWEHLKNPEIYNSFYNTIHPYIIEYPFAYQYYDQILQDVREYTKVYKYTQDDYGEVNEINKIELDDVWFNKAILYNGQQCSGMLNLVPKPANNLQQYSLYPIYGTSDKTIIYTKSDNYYQYNTFWNVLADRTQPMFTRTCTSLSYDKELNQSNMDYSRKSFRKEPLKAKDLKIRHILDDTSDVHMINQIIYSSSQTSYK